MGRHLYQPIFLPSPWVSGLYWSNINLNHPLKASPKRHQPEETISTLHSTWRFCPQHCCWLYQAKQTPTSFQGWGWTPAIVSPGHLARAGVHPQNGQATGGPNLQPRATQVPTGTTSTAGPRLQQRWGSVENLTQCLLCCAQALRHLCIPFLVTLLLNVFSAASNKQQKDFWLNWKGILHFLGYLEPPTQHATRDVLEVYRGDVRHTWLEYTWCEICKPRHSALFSLSAQFKLKNFKLGASLGRLHCIAILLKVVSFNPVTKSYTNSLFFILSWIPWKSRFSAHWNFSAHAFKCAGSSQLNTTKGRHHQLTQIQQDPWQMRPDKGSPNWSSCTRKNNPIKTTTMPDTRVLMGWRDFIAAQQCVKLQVDLIAS